MTRRITGVGIAGLLGLALLLVGSYIGLFVAPAERYMGEVQRIMYVHVPSAWVAMLCYTAAFGFAIAGLWSGRPRWDALTTGLLEAGFTVSASWPVNTEAGGSLHIRNKAAARSTVILVCRPRQAREDDRNVYWEDVEPLVGRAVRRRIPQIQQAGISGVDLYLSCFGPALEEPSSVSFTMPFSLASSA